MVLVWLVQNDVKAMPINLNSSVRAHAVICPSGCFAEGPVQPLSKKYF